MGHGSFGARICDVVCILYGCPVPIVLRLVEDEFVSVEDCHLHGFVDGEVVKMVDGGILQEKKFNIR